MYDVVLANRIIRKRFIILAPSQSTAEILAAMLTSVPENKGLNLESCHEILNSYVQVPVRQLDLTCTREHSDGKR